MTSAHRAGDQNGKTTPDEQLVRLRTLLMGPELDVLRGRLDDRLVRAEETSEVIAEAIALRSQRGSELRNALQPSIEEALRISVQRDPHVLADLLFPVIAPAIRRAVASSLNGMMDTLNKGVEQRFSLRAVQWRLESWRTGRSFGEIVLLRSLLYRVEQVFLIHKETGLLLQHAVAESAVIQDADLVSGMLTAIQDFVRDSFGGAKSEELENMQVGEFQVWVQHGPYALLAAVVRGTPPAEFRSMLQDRLERIHSDKSESLGHFNGDTTPFETTQPLLQSCLTGRLEKERPRRSLALVFSVAALLVVLLCAALLALYARDQRRWSAYVQRLRSEPGILVTSAEAGVRKFRISGMRDPLANEPQQLLGQMGIPPDRVTAHWEPYVSLNPLFESKRRLRASRESVERQALFFKTASTEIAPEAIWPVATEIRSLLRAAAASGGPVTVELTGWTDPFGPDAVNAKLGQQRAERVAAELISQGVPADRIVAKSGDLAPKAEEGGRSDWYRRRVSFQVVSMP